MELRKREEQANKNWGENEGHVRVKQSIYKVNLHSGILLYKHKLAYHAHEDVKFIMEITQKFKDAMTRQANEAVRIYSRPVHERAQ